MARAGRPGLICAGAEFGELEKGDGGLMIVRREAVSEDCLLRIVTCGRRNKHGVSRRT